MVDCRSLIEFCRAFDYNKNMPIPSAVPDGIPRCHQNRSKKQPNHPQSSFPPLCEQSSAAAVDIIILLLVLGACGFLLSPYFKYFGQEAAEFLPATILLICDVIYEAPIAYASGAVLMFAAIIGCWEIYQYKSRRCDNPRCRGLRKTMEFDIQLETEQCVKASSPVAEKLVWNGREFGDDHKELEAELRRMAPPNGRAVLVFRSPCGCPAARMEVWGSKKPRKFKK